MNGFRKLQDRLREEGWYVGWNLPCCQSCAWSALPDYLDAKYDDDGYLIREHPETGEQMSWDEIDELYGELDLSKVLFNHSQDCEFDMWEILDDALMEKGIEDTDEFYEEYDEASDEEQDGEKGAVNTVLQKWGIESILEDVPDLDRSVAGFACYTPEQQDQSTFCFDGSKEGVKNLKEIIPIIEECGCKIHWNGSGESRPTISWECD